ncbi:hypothetical protein LJB93_02650 [Desulfovibrio sp. OttesenSCG-928-F07]|nr:hypothetical protein [Desulfovibrio sp. OttesenSCG-928-F07]
MKIPLTKNKPEVACASEQNSLGKPFDLELNQQVIINDLTLCFEYSSIKRKKPFLQGEGAYEVLVACIKLLKDGEEETVCFDSDALNEKEPVVFEWKGYAVQILNICYPNIVQLKVEKTT